MNYRSALTAILLVLVISGISFPAPGDLDITFGSSGFVRTGFGSGDDFGYCTAIQPDGKLIVAGMSKDGESYESSLLRYNSDGSPDISFNGSGKVITSLGTYGSRTYGIAVLPDGKIVTAGAIAYQGGSPNQTFRDDILIVRYNADGSLDTTFDGDGKVITAIGMSGIAIALGIQTDGKILITGGALIGSQPRLIVARYNPNGTPDLTFDSDGWTYTALGEQGAGIDLQVDGKIVVTGYKNGISDFVTLRFNPDGSLDTSFNKTGEAPLPPGGAEDRARAVTVQTDGKIVVSGTWGSTGATGGRLVLVRYNPDGSFDGTFGDSGFLDSGMGSSSVNRLIIQSDGKIIVGTTGFDGNETSFKAARFNSDGSPDPEFNGTGTAEIPVGKSAWAAGLALGVDGKIVVAGYTFRPGGFEFAAVRFTANGSDDPSFGSDGKVVNDIGHTRAEAVKVRLQTDGKMVACGSRLAIESRRMILARYSAEGLLDASFGSNGQVFLDVGDNTTDCADLAIQADGRITVAGTASAVNRKVFFVARFNTDGSPDINFGSGGKVTTAIGVNDEAAGLVLQPDGKIVVAGTTGPSWTNTDIAVVRYDPDGSLDSTFDGDGKAITIFDSFPDRIVTKARAVAVQDDGGIVVTGFAGPPDHLTHIPVVRYGPDGSLDRSFNRTGKLLVPVGKGGGYDLQIQADGKLVIAGQCVQGNNPVTCLLRLEPGGHLDPTFNGTGKITVNHGPGSSNAASLSLRPDGKIIVGAFASDSYNRNFAALRVNEDGSLDPAWGFNGITSLSLGEYDSFGSLAVDAFGRVILAGQKGDLLALARLRSDLAPVSPFAVVTGRVLDTNWQAVSGATVAMTDAGGSIRTVQTNSFGYYRLEGVRVGEAYTFLAGKKRLRFRPRLLTIVGDYNGPDLIAY